MKGTIQNDKNTIRLPRQNIPGKVKSLKIRQLLCFLLGFTNGLPIFLESQDLLLSKKYMMKNETEKFIRAKVLKAMAL